MAKVNIPKVDLNGLTGTTDDIISQATTLTRSIVNTVISPFLALHNTVKTSVDTAKNVMEAAKKAYQVIKTSNPAKAQKLLKAAESAERYYDKLNSYGNSMNGTYQQVMELKKEIEDTINNSEKHSREWVSDQVNFLVGDINNQIEAATDWVNEKLNNLTDHDQKKTADALEKEKNKLEEKILTKAKQKLERIKSDARQKQHINKLKDNAPKSAF